MIHPDGLTRYPSLSSPNGLLRCLDWLGTVSFACSGTLTAGYAGLDLLGCTIVGTITAIGGGTVRDMLLGSLPVFWMVEYEYILLSIATCGLTFFGWKELENRKLIEEDGALMWWTDTLGVGAFCVIGAQNGIRRNMSFVICVICGLLTTTFGGVIRDTLCKRPVRILNSHAELYGTTALCGASAFLVARSIGANPAIRMTAGAVTAMSMRYWASDNNIKLPLAPWYQPRDVSEANKKL